MMDLTVRRRLVLPVWIGLLLGCLASAGLPQGIGGEFPTLHRIDGAEEGEDYGFAVTTGNLDDDGFADIVVAAPGNAIFVYSGVDASLIRQIDVPAAGFLGIGLDTADFDQDGCDDILYSYGTVGTGPSAFAYSGRTGALLFDLSGGRSFGSSSAAIGDVNFDGHPDLVVGEDDATIETAQFAGRTWVFSGVDGGLIAAIERTTPRFGDNFGAAVASAGDQNGDGIEDIAIGVPGADAPGLDRVGAVCIYSGLDFGVPLSCHFASMGNPVLQQYGASIANLGDVDGDGRPNLLVGANFLGAAFVLDSDHEVLYSLVGDGPFFNDFFGDSVASAGDADDDGVPDFLVAQRDPDAVFLFSGSDASLIQRFDPEPGASRLEPAGRPGDLDGDGIPEIVLGQQGTSRGAVHAIRLQKFLSLDGDELSASTGIPLVASLDFPGFDGGNGYALLASITGTGPTTVRGLEIPLTRDAVFDLFVSGNVPGLFRDARGALDPRGDGTITVLSRPQLAGAVGTVVQLAVVSHIGRNPVRSSRARAFEIVP